MPPTAATPAGPAARTDRADRAFALAGDEATGLAVPVLGTEHLLLGLIREEAEAGDRLVGVEAAPLRALLPHAVPTAEAPRPPCGRRALAAVEMASRLARERAVGVRHLLLGVLADPDAAAVTALDRLGRDVGDVWAHAVADLEGDRSGRALTTR